MSMLLPHPRSVELDNDATHDSTVDTDGKQREATRLANGTLPPDEVTTSNASLDNAMPETPDGFAGYDSRPGGNHPQCAPRPGYMLIDKGFAAAPPASVDLERVVRPRGRTHWPVRPVRAERVFEFARIPR
jgi:hypothetical protein